MKILFISHKYPPTIGGMEKQCFELIHHTSKQHEVVKLVYVASDEHKALFFIKLRTRIKEVLRANPDIDLIHLNDGLMAMLCIWLKRYTQIPIIATLHGLDIVFPNPLYQNAIRKHFNKFDGFICVSQSTANEAQQRGIDAKKLYVAPNGVDHDIAQQSFDSQDTLQYIQTQFGQDLHNKKILITLGRPVKRKGFSWFLENVFPKLDEDIVLLMVGPLSKPKWSLKNVLPTFLWRQIELTTGGENDEAKIHRFLQESPVGQRIIQTGRLPFEKVQALLHLADIFVMPNIKMYGDVEGFGLVALEAALSKTMVLASNIDGIPEAIKNDKNGILIPSKNADVWVDKIHECFANPTKLQQKASAFKAFTLKNYSWQKMASDYEAIFNTIVQPSIGEKINYDSRFTIDSFLN